MHPSRLKMFSPEPKALPRVDDPIAEDIVQAKTEAIPVHVREMFRPPESPLKPEVLPQRTPLPEPAAIAKRSVPARAKYKPLPASSVSSASTVVGFVKSLLLPSAGRQPPIRAPSSSPAKAVAPVFAAPAPAVPPPIASTPAEPAAPVGPATPEDIIPPEITLKNFQDGQWTNLLEYGISGTINEPARMSINGIPIAVHNDLSFTGEIWLSEGMNTLTLKARDRIGNEAVRELTVGLDTNAPMIIVGGLPDGTLTKEPKRVLKGYLDEDATLTFNGDPVTLEEGRRFTIPTTLKEGKNTLILHAVDRVGHTGTVTLHAVLDTIAPELEVQGVPKDGWTDNAALNLTGTVSEPATLTLNNAAVSIEEDLSFSASVTLKPGLNTLVLAAKDTVGHITQEIFDVTFAVPPRIKKVTLPEKGLFVLGEVSDIGVQATDPQDGALLYRLLLDDEKLSGWRDKPLTWIPKTSHFGRRTLTIQVKNAYDLTSAQQEEIFVVHPARTPTGGLAP